MYPTTRVFLKDDNGDKFFGEGPCRLLEGIERTGSLRASAQEMEMAYTKAIRLLKHAEETLGFPLTERTIGGKGGGGSRLTDQAREFVRKYKTYRDACYQANLEIYQTIFQDETAAAQCGPSGPDPRTPRLACILMASGLGQRFGGNKLMAPFCGEPLICRILAATDSPLFCRRIVVTRHPEIAGLCEKKGVQTVLHSLPYRSDTVRLGLEALCGEDPAETRPPDSRTASDGGTGSDSASPDGCMFCACDQPFLSRETVETMARAFLAEPAYIYRLASGGTPGNPILFPKEYFHALRNLPQDKGGAWIARAFPDQVRYIEAASPRELEDTDTPENLRRLETIAAENRDHPAESKMQPYADGSGSENAAGPKHTNGSKQNG